MGQPASRQGWQHSSQASFQGTLKARLILNCLHPHLAFGGERGWCGSGEPLLTEEGAHVPPLCGPSGSSEGVGNMSWGSWRSWCTICREHVGFIPQTADRWVQALCRNTSGVTWHMPALERGPLGSAHGEPRLGWECAHPGTGVLRLLANSAG